MSVFVLCAWIVVGVDLTPFLESATDTGPLKNSISIVPHPTYLNSCSAASHARACACSSFDPVPASAATTSAPSAPRSSSSSSSSLPTSPPHPSSPSKPTPPRTPRSRAAFAFPPASPFPSSRIRRDFCSPSSSFPTTKNATAPATASSRQPSPAEETPPVRALGGSMVVWCDVVWQHLAFDRKVEVELCSFCCVGCVGLGSEE